ncbi:MAG: hypothetical protein MRK02_09085 [Candidatus Scalindua sp.]|nr:hypothetical protein [Candidatus Scalindua sp.]
MIRYVFCHSDTLIVNKFGCFVEKDFIIGPAKEMAKVLQFLNMPEFEFDLSAVRNVGDYQEQMDKDVREYLISVFCPQNQKLSELKGRNLDWSC